MKKQKSKSKISTLALILMLTIAATLVALPTVMAQDIQMNLPGDEGVTHYVLYQPGVLGYDIDLNGAHPGGDMELWFTTPSDPTWTMFGSWFLEPGSDLDIYDFDFTELGIYQFKWMLGGASSNIEIAEVVTELPPTYASTQVYCFVQPVAAIGQQMFMVFWTESMPPDIGETAGTVSAPSSRAGWYGVSFTITKPDGTTDTYTHPYSDPVGGGYYLYTPNQIGEYSVVANFPGAWKNSTNGNVWYYPTVSRADVFTVRNEPIAGWPEAPPPNDYWNRPVSGASHSWAGAVGNWLGSYANQFPVGSYGGNTRPYGYGAAPESAHILWTYQHYPSGSLMDERYGTKQYTLNHYQDVDWDGDVIVDGVVHFTPQYTGHWGEGNAVGSFGWGGLDLYTGELLFLDPEVNEGMPDFGQIFLYDSPNQHGGFSYLIREDDVELPEFVIREPQSGPDENVTLTEMSGTNTWEILDAYTRNRVCYIANVSDGGQMVNSKIGAICFYDTTREGGNYYLTVWNSTAALSMYGEDPPATGGWQWRPQWGGHANYQYRWRENVNAFHDGNDCWSSKVQIPSLRGPSNARLNQTASIRVVREDEYVIFGTDGRNDADGIAPAWFMAVSLVKGQEGTMLWETTLTPPSASVISGQFVAGIVLDDVIPEDEVILYSNRQTQKYWAYDMMTGQLLWEIQEAEQGHYYSMNNIPYDGMLITWGRIGGKLRAYDLRTGDIVWEYTAQGEGTETPYGDALVEGAFIADDKVYFGSSEHSASSPLWRTPGLRCIDAQTGEELWKILWWGTDTAVADGILVGFNWYDGQVYGFGKGPSATTVTAPDTGVPLGSSVVIRGTVTDQTPTGRRNINGDLQFSLKDTPAISDKDMAAWMEYKFMQQGYPTMARGVEVVLSVLDSNNNYYEIGRTTSDITGAFSLRWKPQIPGDFYIYAEFEGSNSYGPSSASTAIFVDEAPSAAQPIEPEPTTPTPTTPEPTTPEPTTPEPTTPEPTTPEPTTPEPTTPEPTEPAEAPLITTEVAIIAAIAVACVIGIVSFWALRKRK